MVVPFGGVTWLPYRILSISHKKELLWSLWVAVGDVLWHVDPKQKVIATRGGGGVSKLLCSSSNGSPARQTRSAQLSRRPSRACDGIRFVMIGVVGRSYSRILTLGYTAMPDLNLNMTTSKPATLNPKPKPQTPAPDAPPPVLL